MSLQFSVVVTRKQKILRYRGMLQLSLENLDTFRAYINFVQSSPKSKGFPESPSMHLSTEIPMLLLHAVVVTWNHGVLRQVAAVSFHRTTSGPHFRVSER